MHIFLNSSDEEENDQQNVYNLEIDDVDSQQDSQEDHDIQTYSQCIKTNCVCPPQINAISKEQEFIFTMFDKIEDLEIRKECLRTYTQLFVKGPQKSSSINLPPKSLNLE